MAQLSVMLEWNRKFLPGAKELDVNQRIFDDYQGNRNPYIDFPEFADAIWVSGPSWGSWRLDHFSLEELTDTLISGDNADPDGDRLSNIMEMARYSDPRSAESSAVLEFSSVNDTLYLSFSRADDVSNLNLQLILERSSDLLTWDEIPLDGATVDPNESNTETVTLALTLTEGTAYFYRLNASRPAL